MRHRLPRLALLPATGLALVLTAGGFALAAGDKPAKPGGGGKAPPAAPGGAKGDAPAVQGKSLGEIESAFEAKEDETRKALRTQRMEAIVAYVAKNGSAKDAEEARKTLVDLAEELEQWPKVVQFADEFLAAHAASEQKVDVAYSRAAALSNLGKDEDAKKAYEALTKDVKDGNAQVVWNVWSAYAEHLVGMGDLEGGKKAYESAKEAANHPQVNQLADAAILAIDLIGKEATPFPDGAKDLDGKPVSLGDFKDKVLLIDFWATWCPPCRREMPNVIEAYGKFHDKGFEIVGVSLDHPNETAKVRDFTTAKKMPWRQVYYPDGENQVVQAYNVNSIPHTVLVGRDGKVLRIGLRGPALQRALTRILEGGAGKPTGKQ